MLRFKLYSETGIGAEFQVDPTDIFSVVDIERPARGGGVRLVALLTRCNGEEVLVEDDDRDVARRVHEAQHQLLLARLKQAGNRQRAEFYLSLLWELVEITRLEDGDPRLAMRMGYGDSVFDVTINRRSVLAAERHYVYRPERPYKELRPSPSDGHNTMELILPDRLEAVLRRLPAVLGYSTYADGARWVRFSVLKPFELPTEVRDGWHEAILAERDWANGTRVRLFHQTVLYQAADPKYRQQVLDQVWPPH